MQGKTLWRALLILSGTGMAHLVVSVAVYTTLNLLCGLFFLAALLHMWFFIRYFTLTLQYVLARRLAKRRKEDKHLLPNGVVGLVLLPLLTYAFFVMAFGHLSRVIETLG